MRIYGKRNYYKDEETPQKNLANTITRTLQSLSPEAVVSVLLAEISEGNERSRNYVARFVERLDRSEVAIYAAVSGRAADIGKAWMNVEQPDPLFVAQLVERHKVQSDQVPGLVEFLQGAFHGLDHDVHSELQRELVLALSRIAPDTPGLHRPIASWVDNWRYPHPAYGSSGNHLPLIRVLERMGERAGPVVPNLVARLEQTRSIKVSPTHANLMPIVQMLAAIGPSARDSLDTLRTLKDEIAQHNRSTESPRLSQFDETITNAIESIEQE